MCCDKLGIALWQANEKKEKKIKKKEKGWKLIGIVTTNKNYNEDLKDYYFANRMEILAGKKYLLLPEEEKNLESLSPLKTEKQIRAMKLMWTVKNLKILLQTIKDPRFTDEIKEMWEKPN